jgi:hypothetical protein
MIRQLICITLIDMFNINFHYINLNKSARWFLLHSIINVFIIYDTLPDLITCYKNPTECYKMEWNYKSKSAYYYALTLHLYHILFFKLKSSDYLHHFFMVSICGTLCYCLRSILSSVGLFFLSGLPGSISYFLLYLVKIDRLKIITEKNVSKYLSLYIRSPGCICTAFIGTYGIIDYYNSKQFMKFIILVVNLLLIFWNGQYYLISCYDSYINYYLKHTYSY